MALLVLVLMLVCQSLSAPYRRNWTPQAMLYLKGAQGHGSVVKRGRQDNVNAFPHVMFKQSNDLLKTSLPTFNLLMRLMERGGEHPYDGLSDS